MQRKSFMNFHCLLASCKNFGCIRISREVKAEIIYEKGSHSIMSTCFMTCDEDFFRGQRLPRELTSENKVNVKKSPSRWQCHYKLTYLL